MDILNIPPEEYDDDGLQNLAIGIIRQAAEDYKDAFLGRYVDGKTPEFMMSSLEWWFRSDHYQMLTKYDGERLMSEIRINALEELMETYKKFLSKGDGAQFKLYIQNPGKQQNTTLVIPPNYMDPFRKTMTEQIKKLNKEIEKEKRTLRAEKSA